MHCYLLFINVIILTVTVSFNNNNDNSGCCMFFLEIFCYVVVGGGRSCNSCGRGVVGCSVVVMMMAVICIRLYIIYCHCHR